MPHRSGRFERWFPGGTLSAFDRTVISALRVRGERAILVHLLHRGPSRFSLLRTEARVSAPSLSRYLSRLTQQGLVVLTEGRLYSLADPSALEFRLSSYRARFPELLADAAREIFDESV